MYKLGIPQDMRMRLFGGTVGSKAAVSFVTHLDYYSKLQDPDTILADPDKARIESEPALLYTTCGALAARASRKTMPAIVKYADRMEAAGYEEFSVLLVKDAGLKDANTLMACPSFIDWASRHHEQISL
jgi:hypothetical protein